MLDGCRHRGSPPPASTACSGCAMPTSPRVDFSLDRYPPAPDLAGLVERHWLVSWELPPGREASVTLLPHPCVNVVLDGGRLAVLGVGRDRFTYVYRGVGRVFGVKFRPGGVPAVPRPAAVRDHRRGAARRAAVGPGRDRAGRADDGRARRRRPGRARSRRSCASAGRRPTRRWSSSSASSPRCCTTARSRASTTSPRCSTSPPRTLQRLFQRYVGVSPKWVLRRYRLHEAAAALAREQHRPWAEVAAELGYFDQSHFIRDFTAAIGMTPSPTPRRAGRRRPRSAREPVTEHNSRPRCICRAVCPAAPRHAR